MNKLKMAIVGHGFVGNAVDYGFPDNKCDKIIIDPKYGNTVEDLSDEHIDVSFVCVPTPMGENAEIDSTILINTIDSLLKYTTGIIAVKSTVIPSIISRYNTEPRLVYNPEFLTERAACDDFVNPFMHVFGGEPESTAALERIYQDFSICKQCVAYHVTLDEASFIKYGINSFLAAKVLFFNQLYDMTEKYGSNYDVVRNAIGTDPRIGNSHTMVPGPDGRKGFGSACFSKDCPAFVMFARDLEADFTVLEEVVRRNQDYRNEYHDVLPRERQQNVKFDYKI